jgi:hypothetical protein
MKKMFPLALVLSVVLLVGGVVLGEFLQDLIDKRIVYGAFVLISIFLCFEFISKSGRTNIALKIGAVIVPIITLFIIGLLGKSEELYRKETLKKEIDDVNLKVSQLKIIKHREVIDNDEYDSKFKELKSYQKELWIKYYLVGNKDFESLKNALAKNFIDDKQYQRKLDSLKGEIEKKVRI